MISNTIMRMTDHIGCEYNSLLFGISRTYVESACLDIVPVLCNCLTSLAKVVKRTSSRGIACYRLGKNIRICC